MSNFFVEKVRKKLDKYIGHSLIYTEVEELQEDVNSLIKECPFPIYPDGLGNPVKRIEIQASYDDNGHIEFGSQTITLYAQ